LKLSHTRKCQVADGDLAQGHFEVTRASATNVLPLHALVVLVALLVTLAVFVLEALDALIVVAADLAAVAVAIGLALDALLVRTDLVAVTVPIVAALLLAQHSVACRGETGYPKHTTGERLQ